MAMTDVGDGRAGDTALLEKAAREAWAKAYAPYSGFHVGAALETEDGEIVTGCNVENLSYGLTLCAERVAVVSAVALGHRRFRRILIYSASSVPVSPCGACRQVLAEFAPNLEVIGLNAEGERWNDDLRRLLPRAKDGILDVPRGT